MEFEGRIWPTTRPGICVEFAWVDLAYQASLDVNRFSGINVTDQYSE